MMEREKFLKFILNFLILAPSISMFAYEIPKEFSYWDSLWYIFFILPLLKYVSPLRIRRLVYPVAIIIGLMYVLISELMIVQHTSSFLSGLFSFPMKTSDLIIISFTISSAIAFPLIVEGVMSKSPQGVLGYLIGSSISTIYFIAALSLRRTFSDLFSELYPNIHISPFYSSYMGIGELIFFNVYILASQGFEFITLIITPVAFITNMLIITFSISIISFIARLYLENNRINRQPLENMAYPIMIGGIGALVLTLVMNQISYCYYGILLMAVSLVSIVVIMRMGNKKDNYEVGTLE